MRPETILIVEDDPPTAELLKAIFEKERYSVSVARDGREALQRAATIQPKLILLDVILPDMEGYEVIRRLKANPETTHLPVVILTSRHDFEDKIRGLRLGALEYLTKPFQRQELTYRIRNILHFCRAQGPNTAAPEENQPVQALLERMVERHIQALIPKTNRDARLGFEYPEAAEIFKPAEIGAEVERLEHLADQKVLERVFFDTIHLCPACGHHDLNFREVCPYCETAEIEPVRLLVHRSCGMPIQPESDGLCPKCGAEVSLNDEDFVQANAYRCDGCGKTFAEPVVTCRCMNCDRIFDVDEALKRTIYSYRLHPDSRERARLLFDEEQAPILDPPDEPPWGEVATESGLLEWVVQHGGLAVLEEADLQSCVEQLIRRAEQKNSSLTLMAVQMLRLTKLAQQLQRPVLQRLMRHVSQALKRSLRPEDRVVVRKADQILLVMPDTPMGIARIVADRIRSRLLHLEQDLGCQFTLASYPEDGVNAHEVLAILDAGIVSLSDEMPDN